MARINGSVALFDTTYEEALRLTKEARDYGEVEKAKLSPGRTRNHLIPPLLLIQYLIPVLRGRSAVAFRMVDRMSSVSVSIRKETPRPLAVL